ncbi:MULTISPECIES: hypothetical protein [Thermus]|uniref:hypothetical protein n=1 Tax=Thermus TaxID=270 RepID=UPI002FED584A
MYSVDLAKGRAPLQVYVDGVTGKVLGSKSLKERALRAKAWLRENPGIPLKEAIALAQRTLGAQEFPQEVAFPRPQGRPVLQVDCSREQVLLDARTRAYLGKWPTGR